MKNILFLLAFLAGFLATPTKSLAQTPTDKQIAAIEKYMAPLRKKVTDILEADKTGQYKTYKSDLEIIAKETDPARRNELTTKLDRDHLAFIGKAYKAGVINHEEMRLKLATILGHSNFTLGEFGDFQIEFIPAIPPLPQKFDTEFACPMEAADNFENANIASACVAQGGNCSTDVQCMAEIVGGCRGKTSLGDNFVLPAGTFTKITVVTQTDISHEGWVFALGSYSQINADFGIRFRAPGIDKVVFTKRVFAMAPLVWYRHVVGNSDNFVSNASFTGSFPEGTTITAQAYLEGFAYSVPALGLSLIYGYTENIDFIRITGTN